jgi:hypothetical protein
LIQSRAQHVRQFHCATDGLRDSIQRSQRLIARPQILFGAMQAQHRSHTRQQFLVIERLGDVIVRANVKAERLP